MATQAPSLWLWRMSSPDGAPVYADLSRHDGGLWQQAGSVTFVIYMVIGFSATMGLIVLIVGGYMLLRYRSHKHKQNHLPHVSLLSRSRMTFTKLFDAMACRRFCCPVQQSPNQLPQERPAMEGVDNLPMFNSEPAFLVVNPGEVLRPLAQRAQVSSVT